VKLFWLLTIHGTPMLATVCFLFFKIKIEGC